MCPYVLADAKEPVLHEGAAVAFHMDRVECHRHDEEVGDGECVSTAQILLPLLNAIKSIDGDDRRCCLLPPCLCPRCSSTHRQGPLLL